ncbi:MAG: PhoH family protein [Planctomycetaceae bacterium]
MSQTILHFDDQEQIRRLFGCQDQHLRLVRDRLDISVVVRGEELRLSGDQDQVQTGLKVLTELQAILHRHGELFPAEVERSIDRHTGVERSPQFQGQAQSRLSATGEKASVPAGDNDVSRQTRSGGSPGGNGVTAIDLFEKARLVRPKTPGQEVYVDAIRSHDLVFSTGPAGCGKTYLAVAMALNALRTERVRKIVLVRPAVEAGEKLGFLPGDMLAKVNPYLRPLLDALVDILSFDQVKRYMEHDIIEIVPLAFMRGRTLNDTFIILDEAQNTTATQMKMFLTRMGEGSKIVVTGDPTQVDLPERVKSGLGDAISRLGRVSGVEAVILSGHDIVRHRLVREIVKAYDSDNRRGSSAT